MQAIALKRKDFREVDQMISFYTRECGKLELLARGIKKIESKNSPHVEPFSYADIEFAAGKELYHLTKVQPIQSFKNIRSDLHKSLVAEYASKLLDVIVEQLGSAKGIFYEAMPGEGNRGYTEEKAKMLLEKYGVE